MPARKNPPVELPSIRSGEIDGRAIDLTNDLGAVEDRIVSLDTVTITILRRDGFPITADDLAVAGFSWPNTLDSTGLILTIGLTAPAASALTQYRLTLTVNKTMQARLFVRDVWIDVLAAMG